LINDQEGGLGPAGPEGAAHASATSEGSRAQTCARLTVKSRDGAKGIGAQLVGDVLGGSPRQQLSGREQGEVRGLTNRRHGPRGGTMRTGRACVPVRWGCSLPGLSRPVDGESNCSVSTAGALTGARAHPSRSACAHCDSAAERRRRGERVGRSNRAERFIEIDSKRHEPG
jgi:hypothetical protein